MSQWGSLRIAEKNRRSAGKMDEYRDYRVMGRRGSQGIKLPSNVDQRETRFGIKCDEDGELSADSIRGSMTQWMVREGIRGAGSC